MKTIRNKTFETNSSSTHSISVMENVEIPRENMHFDVGFGEFGWEFNRYNDINSILEYLHTAICEVYKKDYKKYTDKIDSLLKEKTKTTITWKEPKFVEDFDDNGNIKWCYLDNECGYIDHSEELHDWLKDLFSNDDLLLNTIFGTIIETGNDNDGTDEYFSIDYRDTQYQYTKGN